MLFPGVCVLSYCAFIRSEEITVSIIFGCSESKANAKICSPVMQWLKGEQSTANIVRDLEGTLSLNFFPLYGRYHLPEHHTQGDMFVFTHFQL